MNFTNEQYEEKKTYLKGLFSLGGMSECGKTSAGEYFDKIGIKRMKIIQIEKEMMEERQYDTSNGFNESHFESLYKENQEDIFREFLYRLIEKLQKENVQFASIESLYRMELGAFLKRELGQRMINIYIEAPLEIRVQREVNKIISSHRAKDMENVSYMQVLEKVEEKDRFKRKHGAERVKEISNIIINNNENLSLDEFYKIIDGIGHVLLPY